MTTYKDANDFEERERRRLTQTGFRCNPRLGFHGALSGVRMFADPGHCPVYDCLKCGATVIGDPRGVVRAI